MKLLIIFVLMFLYGCSDNYLTDHDYSEIYGQWVVTSGDKFETVDSTGKKYIQYKQYWYVGPNGILMFDEHYQVKTATDIPKYHYTSTHFGEFEGQYRCNASNKADQSQYFMVNRKLLGNGVEVFSFGDYRSYIIETVDANFAILYILEESDCAEGSSGNIYVSKLYLNRYNVDSLLNNKWVMQ